MISSPPILIAIDADDYHAEHVGRTSDGRQFFLTTPFEPAINGAKGCEFVALYTFDVNGKFIAAEIDSFGPRDAMGKVARKSTYDARLKSLGTVTLERIEVAPFAVEKFDTTFGLVVRVPENDGDVWAVEVQPGNYMAFFEPWNSGEYDT
jgi:hypothetical protein